MKLVTTKALSGNNLVLSSDNITDFTTGTCETYTASTEFDGATVTGTAIVLEGELVVSFSSSVALPVGSCITLECTTTSTTEETTGCKDVEIEYAEDLRIAVLDEDGCLKGYTSIAQAVTDATQKTLCELLGLDAVPQGNLVASDRILTVGDDCSIKSIPVSDITCEATA